MTGNRQSNKSRLASPQAKRAGFTLMEVMVSLAIFTVIILSATGIFKLVIDAQRKEISTQNVEESLKYFLEVVAKEMRSAQPGDGNCGPAGQVFVATHNVYGDQLSFENFYGQCVKYAVQLDAAGNKRFYVLRGSQQDFISPAKVTIDSLRFYLSSGTSTQPMVTINIQAHASSGSSGITALGIQTTIVARVYH